MGQRHSFEQHEAFSTYKNSESIGYIESLMNSMIFLPPNRDGFRNTGSQEVSTPEWMRFLPLPNSNKLSYFVIKPHIKDNERYILWSHGNAGNLESLYPVMMYMFNEMKGKVGIIAYDYEGYGYSGGVCSEKNCYNDLVFMVNHVLTTLSVKKQNLFLFGQSLGTGVVVDFCARHGWKTPIVLLSPYKSISRVLLDPHWTDPLTNLFIDSIDMFTTHHKTDKLLCPIVIYHGVKDRLIHPEHSVHLYNKHRDKITLVLLKDADHNDILDHIQPSQILDMLVRISS